MKEKNMEVKEETQTEETKQTEPVTETKPRERSEKAKAKEPAFVTELKREKKVRIKIPVDKLNKEDSFVPVCINGYIYQVNRGEAVEVPETVADLLEQGGYI